MSSRPSFGSLLSWVVLACSTIPAWAGAREGGDPPITTPFPSPDFHFSDKARDTEYWRLERNADRALASFRDAVSDARKALKLPLPAPGTAAWIEARAAVERAIVARRPAREAEVALIAFVTREGMRVSPAEAE